ncbi:MAG: NAD-dependent epimerase/dehydratase family protein [Rhodospirillales bacterium]|nr:NAD-dependent epimerase/dehydratase family protein [Rhodospirillales bacterium]
MTSSSPLLVTGATGFVGAAVVRQLLAAGHRVRVLIRKDSDRRNLEDVEVDVVIGDLTDAASLRRAVSGCRGLFHLAADYRLWVRNADAMFAANVEGTRTLMRAALDAGVERIVYTSSVATLGIRPGGPADEETPVTFADMIGVYKQSKFLAEMEVQRMAAAEELPVVIVNPSTPIGPRDVKPTPTGRLIVEAAAGRMPAYVETGLNVVHVEDVAAGHVLAFDRGVVGERYILGGEDMSLSTILTEIAALVRRRPPKVKLRHGTVLPLAYAAEAWCRLVGGVPFVTVDGVRMSKKQMFFSSRKAQAQLGYRARPAREALRDAVNYFRGRGLCA